LKIILRFSGIGTSFAAKIKNGSSNEASSVPDFPKTKIVFVTGYPERYSQQIFLENTNLKGFIAKPINLDILTKSLKKIKDEILAEENRKLILKFNGVAVGVDPDSI